MREVVLSKSLRLRLTEVYKELQQEYERVAVELNFSCTGCPDNCCDSYFLHYTYLEWAYLWEGIRRLDPEMQNKIQERANKYYLESKNVLEKGERPQFMCPLNEAGLCTLYENRLLVCRTHGVPATISRPDGKLMQFPGCFRCQELVDEKEVDSPPYVERTKLLRKLAMLEQELLMDKRHLLPKVKLSIAEMIIKGPPLLAKAHCEKKSAL